MFNQRTLRRFCHREAISPQKRYDMGERLENFKTSFFEAFKDTLVQEDFICYPSESNFSDMKKKVSKVAGANPQNISLGSGSDQLIKDFFWIYGQGEALLNKLSFPMYHVYCDMFNMTKSEVEFNEDLNFSVDDFLKKADENVSIAILANPNSPLGDLKSKEEVDYICERLKKKGVYFLLDEAYVDFIDYNCSDLIAKHDNLVISRTFSKAWGGAGCRFGYVISQERNIQLFEKSRPSFPLSGASLKYINFLLDNPSPYRYYVSQTLEKMKVFVQKLEGKFDIIPSATNWVHINRKDDNASLDKILKKHKISFKNKIKIPFDSRKNWARLTIGPETLIQDFFKEMEQI